MACRSRTGRSRFCWNACCRSSPRASRSRLAKFPRSTGDHSHRKGLARILRVILRSRLPEPLGVPTQKPASRLTVTAENIGAIRGLSILVKRDCTADIVGEPCLAFIIRIVGSREPAWITIAPMRPDQVSCKSEQYGNRCVTRALAVLHTAMYEAWSQYDATARACY